MSTRARWGCLLMVKKENDMNEEIEKILSELPEMKERLEKFKQSKNHITLLWGLFVFLVVALLVSFRVGLGLGLLSLPMIYFWVQWYSDRGVMQLEEFEERLKHEAQKDKDGTITT